MSGRDDYLWTTKPAGRSQIGPTCPKCDRIHSRGDVYAVDRFTAVSGYRTPDGEVEASREAAQDHLCRKRQGEHAP